MVERIKTLSSTNPKLFGAAFLLIAGFTSSITLAQNPERTASEVREEVEKAENEALKLVTSTKIRTRRWKAVIIGYDKPGGKPVLREKTIYFWNGAVLTTRAKRPSTGKLYLFGG